MTTLYYQGVKKTIVPRPVLEQSDDFGDLPAILKRIFLARGLTSSEQLERSLSKLPSPFLLSNMETMVTHLIVALEQQQNICIVADIDADGATSCAVAMKGFHLLGAKNVDFVVPNRFEHAYGLTPEIVELATQKNAHVIITVDNGISSHEGVLVAKERGMTVLITDHHLPAKTLPAADAIVNPNLIFDEFPSKSIAGVGVIFYVLSALRSRLRERHWFESQNIPEPNMAQLLDFVALGTVADVVALDKVNRTLVYQGLLRIRNGQGHAGVLALIEVAGKNTATLHASDFGFSVAPRLNAAGRIQDMSLGIHCLLENDFATALKMATHLDSLNTERREIEHTMKQEAMNLLADTFALDKPHEKWGVCLYDANWHQGVIGILAARIKDRLHRPVIAFATAGHDLLKGSGRSIEGVHLRDVLSDIATEHPNLILQFGGHAMAAGLSMHAHHLPSFTIAFNEMVGRRLSQIDLQQKILSDGELTEADLTLEFADLLQNVTTWGQHFPEPIFNGVFEVVNVRILKDAHLKLLVRTNVAGKELEAIAFNVDKPEMWQGMRRVCLAYKLDINHYRGNRNLQLMVQYLEKVL
ncbi:MAG: single-stranded-DNA-specific exonuclease RecJ [Methylococcales bacterium]|nr:single-stranded-DNA-specific exonuclease RecJ [Methylococcales bacterium]